MEQLNRHILLEFMAIAMVSLVLAVAVFAWLRKSHPLFQWNTHGNVWTGPFDWIDGVVALFFLLIVVGQVSTVPPEKLELNASVVMQGIVMQVFLAGVFVFYLGAIRRRDLLELFGLARLRPSRVFFYACLWLSVAAASALGAMHVVTTYVLGPAGISQAPQDIVIAFNDSGSPAFRLLVILSAALVAPVCEEIIFRGFLYPTTKRYSERFFAAILTSIVFACMHGNLAAFVPLFVLAMFFTLAYELTGCLLVPIVMHGIFNTGMLVYMMVFAKNV